MPRAILIVTPSFSTTRSEAASRLKALDHGLEPCTPGCKICCPCIDKLNESTGKPDKPTPPWPRTLHPNRSPGSDGITNSFFRFVREFFPEQRFRERLERCQVLAHVFNSWLEKSRVPTSADFRKSLIKGIPKPPKVGDFDPHNPRHYRCIANIFSLALMARIMH